MGSVTVTQHVTPEEMGVLVIGLNSFTPNDFVVEYFEIRLRWTKAWAKHAPERYADNVERNIVESVEVTAARLEAARAFREGNRALADQLTETADNGHDAVLALRAALA